MFFGTSSSWFQATKALGPITSSSATHRRSSPRQRSHFSMDVSLQLKRCPYSTPFQSENGAVSIGQAPMRSRHSFRRPMNCPSRSSVFTLLLARFLISVHLTGTRNMKLEAQEATLVDSEAAKGIYGLETGDLCNAACGVGWPLTDPNDIETAKSRAEWSCR
jgi:hypothetical protein